MQCNESSIKLNEVNIHILLEGICIYIYKTESSSHAVHIALIVKECYIQRSAESSITTAMSEKKRLSERKLKY